MSTANLHLPTLLAMLICEDCPMSEDGVVSLSRVVDTFNAEIVASLIQPGEPPLSDEEFKQVAVPIRCWLYTKWGGAAGEFEEKVTIVQPDGTESTETQTVKVTLNEGFNFYQVRHQVNLLMRRPGIYRFRVYLNENIMGEHPFMVNIERSIESGS